MCFITSRKQYEGIENLQSVESLPNGYTIACWHGRLLSALWLYGRGNAFAVLSSHKDGEMFSRVLRYFGHDCVRGSSTRGGSAALRQMIKKLRQGCDIAITPDGPKGPPRIVKPGTMVAAKSTKTAVLPVSYSCQPLRHLSSWDSFVLPRPFGTMFFVIEPPIFPADLETDRANALLGQALDRATDTADTLAQSSKKGR
ncbi:lysophospholipid acyltransferase family protein [Desulfurispira natronophila]|uniref:lysophospholipid acyltransferase family protein n=1 Tax=Desulfurispira natronophila TaxID=682562 RepID=UPI001C84943F|nr:lysophospholipid acyltransferase family protein [Desulfurispira natronophila]